MGKYDHICELSGAEKYPQWHRQMTLALKGERLWNHCSTSTNPKNLAELALFQPVQADPSKAITEAEKEKILDWLAKDAQAKALVDRKISVVVASQLSDSQSAREQWEILSQRYSHNDLMSQYELCARIRSEKLKDTKDASRYLGVFKDVRRRFIQMSVTYSNDESIFDLLQGLPDIIEWEIFKEFTMNRMSITSGTTTSSTTSTSTTPLTFEDVTKLFTEKANTIVGRRKLAGPSSEYANAAITPPFMPRVNPTTGLRVHRNNPKGTKCTNPLCAGLPRADNCDHVHCYWPSGGMESKALAWICNKNPRTETAAVAASASPSPSSTSTSTSTSHCGELSCAAIVEVQKDVCCHASVSSTILDSGSTSHLIMDRAYFVDFKEEDRPPVMTANHGSLITNGRGTCVAELVLNGERHRLTLHDCLHAPNALLNLMSVGRMLNRGWDCAFKGSSPGTEAYCHLSHNGKALGYIPSIGNLFYVNLQLLHPNELAASPLLMKEISAIAKSPLMWDLWHAHMGHPGENSVKCLPLVAKGVTVDKDQPLSRYEACIMAKHPRKPCPPSKSPCASHMLNLIHSDLCGPFPVRTPHSKVYFIVFLDDHSHLLNVQLLATKDQALQAWRLVQKLWENHTGRTIKVFRSDNGGEFISTAFTRVLEECRIQQQLASPYAHQQNGKAERAMRTLEGRAFAMLETAGLPSNLWGEAMLTAAYLWNRTESISLPPDLTPYKVVNGTKPDLSHI
jgi:transposase InsO family protein